MKGIRSAHSPPLIRHRAHQPRQFRAIHAGRAIRLLGGRRADWPYRQQQAEAARKIVSAVGRVDYCRVRLQDDQLEPLALSGASILSSTTRADGFVIVPAQSEGYAPGAVVRVYLYDA